MNVPGGDQTLDRWLVTNALPLRYRNGWCLQTPVVPKQIGGGGELEGLLIGANIALAYKRGFARIEVGRNSLALLLINLVHFGWKLMTEPDKCVRISVSNFISEPSHNCFNVRWTRISINSLRIDCPFPFDVPEVIPFCPEKEIMFILISP